MLVQDLMNVLGDVAATLQRSFRSARSSSGLSSMLMVMVGFGSKVIHLMNSLPQVTTFWQNQAYLVWLLHVTRSCARGADLDAPCRHRRGIRTAPQPSPCTRETDPADGLGCMCFRRHSGPVNRKENPGFAGFSGGNAVSRQYHGLALVELFRK